MANKDPSDVIIIIRRTQSGDEVCRSNNIIPASFANVVSNVNTSGLSVGGSIAYGEMQGVE
jgi:hypothetical protein